MGARPTTTIAVESPEAIERLESEILSGDLDELDIEALEDSTALLSVADVRRLMHASRASGTRITFITDDPLRRELISILGGEVRSARETVDTEQPAGITSSNDDLTRKIGYIREPVRDAEHRTTRFARDEPSFSFVTAPPPARQQSEVSARRSTETGPSVASPRSRARPARRQRSRIVATLLVLTTLTVVGGLLAMYYVPTATVTLTPAIYDVSAEITYGVAVPGATWDIAIQPTALDLTLTASATIATTGERFEPNGSAAGTLRLTNAATSEILVPAGTEVVSDSGIAFVTVEDIVIPAADPFGTLTFGSATVGIEALNAGPSGNVEAESIAGQLESGVFFTNLDPTIGGSTRRVQTVSQGDMDALQARASSDINDRVPAEFSAKLATGQQILAGSETREPIALSFNHALGSDATELRLDATQRVSALVYSIDDVHALARERAVESLAAQAGSSVVVLSDSVQLSEPEQVAGAAAPAFVVRASGKAEAVIDPASLQTMPDLLANASKAEAQRIVEAVPGVAAAELVYSPNWLPGGMPRQGERIEVIVVRSAGDSSPEAGSSSTGP